MGVRQASQPASRYSYLNAHQGNFAKIPPKIPKFPPKFQTHETTRKRTVESRDLTSLCLRETMHWSQTESSKSGPAKFACRASWAKVGHPVQHVLC